MPGPALPSPITELAADDGYEYGGGGPEYIEEGLTRGGADIWTVEVTGEL